MEIVFVRHGESVANLNGVVQGRGDYKLTPKGRDQAIRTANALVDFRPYRIYTSPLSRAHETAEIINRPHGVEVVVLEELLEYSLGEFEGLTFEEIVEKYPHVPAELEKGRPFHQLPKGAERDEDVDIRAEAVLTRIMDSGQPRIMVVAHLGILERLIINFAGNHSKNDFSKELDWPLKNCSITRLIHEPIGTRLISFNDVSHLE